MPKDDALRYICLRSAAICEHGYVFPCTTIATGIKESVYKVRKYMKELAKEGYVVKSHEGGYSDWLGWIYCVHGYELTAKGTEHPYYQNELKAQMDWWEHALKEHIYDNKT